MNVTTINDNDMIVLSDLYSQVQATHAIVLMEAAPAETEIPDENQDNEFSGLEEVNISIQDASGFGETLYKGIPQSGSHADTLTCDIVNQDDMYFKVSRLSDKNLNVTVYKNNDVKDTFVSAINFIDEIEKELNIVKQELV